MWGLNRPHLEQDFYDKWELEDALEVIRELTDNEEGFNIIEEGV